jgi:hypothetical protein
MKHKENPNLSASKGGVLGATIFFEIKTFIWL